jgi:hypothetical protein
MVQAIQEFGVIGLGRMGGGLAKQALGKMVVAGFELRGASAASKARDREPASWSVVKKRWKGMKRDEFMVQAPRYL